MSAKDHPNNAPGVPMVYPPAFERLQIKYMNPMVKRDRSRFMPGVAKINHRGRRVRQDLRDRGHPVRKGNILAIVLGHGKTDWVKNVLAADEADVTLRVSAPCTSSTRGSCPPAATPTGLPFMARMQARKMGVLVADIA